MSKALRRHRQEHFPSYSSPTLQIQGTKNSNPRLQNLQMPHPTGSLRPILPSPSILMLRRILTSLRVTGCMANYPPKADDVPRSFKAVVHYWIAEDRV
ncbi:hypothetical protein NMY22_g17452 [Coprinellus aureogranulatus]|nr:hypothetical protein NMY22_g17452 [Coprinellus aureogranulatus]